MTKLSLPQVLDEMLILHSSIATRLLNEFPDAYGVSFTLSPERSYAMARMDVPEGYVDGYREPGLEALANELMDEIAPRMSELYGMISALVSKTDSIFISSLRNTEGGILLKGSIIGGIRAQSISREVYADEGHIMAFSATRFQLTAIIEDAEIAEHIKTSTGGDFLDTWDALESGKFFLNSFNAKKSEVSRLRKWLSHFPSPHSTVNFRRDDQVFRASVTSDIRRTFLAVKIDDELASESRIEAIRSIGMEVLLFDPVRGLAQDESPALKLR